MSLDVSLRLAMKDVVRVKFHYPRFEGGGLTIWDAPIKVDELPPIPASAGWHTRRDRGPCRCGCGVSVVARIGAKFATRQCERAHNNKLKLAKREKSPRTEALTPCTYPGCTGMIPVGSLYSQKYCGKSCGTRAIEKARPKRKRKARA